MNSIKNNFPNVAWINTQSTVDKYYPDDDLTDVSNIEKCLFFLKLPVNICLFILNAAISFIQDIIHYLQTNQTALIHAIKNQENSEVERLLKNPSVNINVQDHKGRTPLHLAVLNGNTNIADILINSPLIDINVQTLKGNTPLHIAIEFECYDIFSSLLKSASLNPRAF